MDGFLIVVQDGFRCDMWLRWRPHVVILYTVWRSSALGHRSATTPRLTDSLHVTVDVLAPTALRSQAHSKSDAVWACESFWVTRHSVRAGSRTDACARRSAVPVA